MCTANGEVLPMITAYFVLHGCVRPTDVRPTSSTEIQKLNVEGTTAKLNGYIAEKKQPSYNFQ